MNEVTIYQRSGIEYDGQLVQVTIKLKNGKTHIIGAIGDILYLDGQRYRTKYEPSEKLNTFGNRILHDQ